MKKLLCMCAIILMLAGCAGMTGKQVTDLTIMGAQTIYAAASGYYEASKAGFSAEDAAKFERYLAGFRLALSTGESVAPFIERWAEFQQGR
jgi:hypothetical protein